MGVLLGLNDLEDCLIDGIGHYNSTQISTYLYTRIGDNDKKIHLTGELLNLYKYIYFLLEKAGESLIKSLENNQMEYSQNILRMALNKWNSEFDKFNKKQ